MTGKSDFYKLDTEEVKKTCDNNHVLNKYTVKPEDKRDYNLCKICGDWFDYKEGYYNCG